MLVLFAGCTQEKSSKQLLEERADSFSTAFFNYQFKEAMKHVDEESEKWLQYVATNVTQEDVDIGIGLLRINKHDVLHTDRCPFLL